MVLPSIKPRRWRVVRITAGCLVAATLLLVGAHLWLQYAPRRVPEGQPPLQRLDGESVATIRQAFNSGHGQVRLLALFSPT